MRRRTDNRYLLSLARLEGVSDCALAGALLIVIGDATLLFYEGWPFLFLFFGAFI